MMNNNHKEQKVIRAENERRLRDELRKLGYRNEEDALEEYKKKKLLREQGSKSPLWP
jgi:hypothetical protein